MPLFRLEGLTDYLKSSPPFLLHIFLAFTQSFDNQLSSYPSWPEDLDDLAQYAEKEAQKIALRGIPKLEVVQTLCLTALGYILCMYLVHFSYLVLIMCGTVCKPKQAQMVIGMASQLEACRSVADDTINESVDRDSSSRCFWSVQILEKIFNPQFCAFHEDMHGIAYPQSASVPPTLPSTGCEDYPSDLYSPYNSPIDHGIVAYYIRMVSNWGHVSLWLHDIRLAKVERPWSPESKYAKLVARIYECDSQLPAKHLLMNVAFTKRTSLEVAQNREYWTPWVLMQVECHALLSLLNHLFIHLLAVRQCSDGSQSDMFLQRTMDMTLFHSS